MEVFVWKRKLRYMVKINMKCKLYKEMKNDTFSKCLIPAFYPLQTLLNYGTAV